MGDVLSAASLLLTIVTVLYALWYPELLKAISVKIPDHFEDRAAPLFEVKKVLFSRAVPLFLSSFIVSLIFVPDALNIIKEILHAEKVIYSSVKTAICVVVLFSICITLHSGNILRMIICKYVQLKNSF